MISAATQQLGAQVVLDQDAKVRPPTGATLVGSFSVAAGADGWDLLQTFTAGQSGKLASIGLQTFQRSGPSTSFTLSLYQGIGTDPNSIPVVQTDFTTTQSQTSFFTGGMVLLDLSHLDFFVEAGSVYSYEVAAQHSLGSALSLAQLVFSLGYAFPGEQLIINHYEGGRAYRRYWVDGQSQRWDLTANFASDRGFQTFVDVSPVPEVPAWLMLLLGLTCAPLIAGRKALLGTASI